MSHQMHGSSKQFLFLVRSDERVRVIMLKQDTIPMTLVTVNFSPMIPEIIKTGPRGILEQGRIVIA